MARDRAAVYARFSSHNQRSESIEIQLDKSRAYCRENGLKVVREYCDYAQTGRDTNRAQFQAMMADARRGLFDFVVIYKVTRIMRNRDEMAMARIMLRKCRVDILYAGEDIAEGSSGVLQLGMLEVLAEYESALDSERIRDGIMKNAERCMANGHAMFGWDIVDGRYEVNEGEAEAVRRCYRLLFEGRTVSEVSRALAPYRTRRGREWTPKAVDRLLRRRQNGGEYRYAGVVKPGGMPAIVPMEWVEAAVKRLDDKTRPKSRLGYEDFRLTGKLYDGRDGSPMVGTSGTGHLGKVYYYYRCRECRRTVRRDVIEADVADVVRAALGDPANREKIARLMVEFERERSGEAPQSSRIEGELRGIELAYDNIWKAIEAGVAPPGGKERIDGLRERQRVLEEELEVARRLESVRLDEGRVLFWLESMSAKLDDETVLRLFVSRVTLGEDGGFEVSFTFDETGDDGGGVRPDSPGLHHLTFVRTLEVRIYATWRGFVLVAG